MKKVLKTIFGFIGFVYLVVAVFAIVCLLNKNKYGYPQFGNKTLFVVLEDSKELGYEKGDLVVLVKPKNEDVRVKDVVFFYDTEFKRNTINVGSVVKKELVNEEETTFYVANKAFSSEYLVGNANDSVRYKTIGGILDLLLSKWGFFLAIIVPFFIMFMVVIFRIYTEIKFGKKNDN